MPDYVDGSLVFDTEIDTNGAQKGLDKLKSTVKKGALAVGGAFTALTAAALSAAGELEQNLGGSAAVFGQYADEMQAKAEEAYKNMGLSASDYLATANKMGALFKGAGFDMEEAADISSKAMQRAADVASIMGISVDVAMESIAGAAKANFTMLDNLGVACNDTTLGAYALEKGIKKSTRAMTTQEKVSLAMEMFLEKTAYAAGNYAKENETLAGSLGTAKAAFNNFLSGAGSAEALVDSALSAGKIVVENIAEIIPRMLDGIAEVFPAVSPVVSILETLGNNLDIIVPAVGAAVAVLGTYKTVTFAVNTAQALLNATMLANPIGLVVGAVAALAAGVTGLIAVSKKKYEEENKDLVQNQELVKGVLKQKEAYDELKQSKEETLKSDLAQVSNAQNLAAQLSNLADENGRVAESDRKRAEFLLNELNTALGTEYSMVDGVIQKYREFTSSIDQLIQKKQAEILLSAHEDEYRLAIENQTEAVNAQSEAYYNLQQEVLKANENLGGAALTVDDVLNHTQAFMDATQYNGGIAAHLNEVAAAYTEASGPVEQYSKDVQKYTDAMAASAEGNFGKAISILDEGNIAFKTSAEVAAEAAKMTVGEVGENYAKATAAVEVAFDNLQKHNTEANKQALADALKHAGMWRTQYEAAGGEIVNGTVTGADGAKLSLGTKMQEIAAYAAENFGSKKPEFVKAAGYHIDGIEEGVEANKERLYTVGWIIGDTVRKGYYAGTGTASPSKEFIKAAKYNVDGLIKGFDDNADRLLDTIENMADKELAAELEKNDALLESEKVYLSESRRMAREKEEAEYREKLASAKTAEAAHKIRNERLKKQQEEADAAYIEELKKTAEKEREIIEAQKEQITELLSERADAAMDALEALLDEQEELSGKLKETEELYIEKTVTFKGARDDGGDLVFNEVIPADLKKQKEEITAYAESLKKLKEAAELPEGFIDAIREMSPEDGADFVNMLLSMDRNALNEYLADWQAVQDASEQVAAEVYADDLAELKTELEKEWGQLPENFFDIGEDSMEAFGNGFMNKLGELMASIRRQISESLAAMTPKLSVVGGIPISGNTTSYDYSQTTYQLHSTNETVAQQLRTISAAETVNKLRGK